MNFIYETPWWLPASLIFVGVVLFITGDRRLELKLKYGGLGLAALGVLFALVSYLLDSPREVAIARTRALVAAVEKRDWPKVQSLLHPAVALVGWKGGAMIVDGARYYAERYDLKSARVTAIDGEDRDGMIAVSMQVVAEIREASGIITRWKLEWEKTPRGWLLAVVEPLGGPLIDAPSMEQRFKGKPRAD